MDKQNGYHLMLAGLDHESFYSLLPNVYGLNHEAQPKAYDLVNAIATFKVKIGHTILNL
jgi:hypothetical protein